MSKLTPAQRLILDAVAAWGDAHTRINLGLAPTILAQVEADNVLLNAIASSKMVEISDTSHETLVSDAEVEAVARACWEGVEHRDLRVPSFDSLTAANRIGILRDVRAVCEAFARIRGGR